MSDHAPETRRVVCVRNDDCEMDLKLHETYQVIPDPRAEEVGWLRLVDETGEDYCYPQDFFRPTAAIP